MSFQGDNRVEFVARIDAHACGLAKVLGDPLVESRGNKLRTGWAFEHPRGQWHWLVMHESEQPVFKDGGCTQHEVTTWHIYGDTDDSEVLQGLVSYLLDGEGFTVD